VIINPAASATAAPSAASGNHTSVVGGIIGGVLGVVIGVGIFAFIILSLRRQRLKLERRKSRDEGELMRTFAADTLLTPLPERSARPFFVLPSAARRAAVAEKSEGHTSETYGNPPGTDGRQVTVASSSQYPDDVSPNHQPTSFGQSDVSTNVNGFWVAALPESHEKLPQPALGAYALEGNLAAGAHPVAAPVDHDIADAHDDHSVWSFHASHSTAPPSYRRY
jgi:hypothetical protein